MDGKTVVITGGAKGIGYHIADKFLLNKAKVVILLDLDEESGNKTVAAFQSKYGEGKAAFLKCNVITDLKDTYEVIINTYKNVDVLINNAGGNNPDSIRDTLALNTVAPVEWTMKFLEHMRVDAGGSGGTIINVSSVLGFYCTPFFSFYSASKHAILGFSKTIGHMKNYTNHGVRVVVLCPGFTRTALVHFGEPQVDMTEDEQELLSQAEWQDPDVVGEAAVEVFGKAKSGTVWMVQGGKPAQQV